MSFMNEFGDVPQFSQMYTVVKTLGTRNAKKKHITSTVPTHPSITFVSKIQAKCYSCK